MAAAVVGTGRVRFERAVGRTVADAGAVGVSDGTPELVIERAPNREGYGHHRRSGANGVRPTKPSMVTNNGSAAAAVADGTGHLRGGPVADASAVGVVVFGARRHDPR